MCRSVQKYMNIDSDIVGYLRTSIYISMITSLKNRTFLTGILRAFSKLVRKYRECAEMCRGVQKYIGVDIDVFGSMRTMIISPL